MRSPGFVALNRRRGGKAAWPGCRGCAVSPWRGAAAFPPPIWLRDGLGVVVAALRRTNATASLPSPGMPMGAPSTVPPDRLTSALGWAMSWAAITTEGWRLTLELTELRRSGGVTVAGPIERPSGPHLAGCPSWS